MDEGARIAALERQVDALRARVDALEAVLVGPAVFPVEWKLTASEARVLGCLSKRAVATKDQIMAALYDERINGGPDPKIVDGFVCKLRRKVTPFGIVINTRWGVGYSLGAPLAAVA